MMSNMHMFPFKKVQADSKIVIYGCGLIGKSYIDQVKLTSYCNILVCFDREKYGQTYKGIEIKEPEMIGSYSAEFDYIIMALGLIETVETVKESLIKQGVPEKKILYTDSYGDVSGIEPRKCGQLYGGISYAQHGDDLMVVNIFTLIGIKYPSYIDIGAHHPYNISNTALLYSRGSRGINIEVNPDLIEEFYKERPDDINVRCGVAGKSGSLPFYIVDNNPGQNGFDRKIIESHNLKIVRTINFPVKTLKQIIEEYADNVFPDYLTIDVEGLEYEVLENYDFKENGPKVISVELNDIKVRELLSSMGFFPYCSTGGNLICVKEEYRNKLYCAWPSWHNGGE